MSEAILKALMQLFAIISKQGGVKDVERQYIKDFLLQQLNQEILPKYLELFDAYVKYDPRNKEKKTSTKTRTSVKDSVRTLSLCRKINQTLTQRQKIVVVIRLLELIGVEDKASDDQMEIIDTAAKVFRIQREEYKLLKQFVIEKFREKPLERHPEVVVIDNRKSATLSEDEQHIWADLAGGHILVIRVKSVDLYFLKYKGDIDLYMNGLSILRDRVYTLAPGSIIKVTYDTSIYYSDITTRFLRSMDSIDLSFEAENISYQFPNGNYGIRDMNIREGPGKLVGIMGASGSGKSTLTNVLNGKLTPTEGHVRVNQIDVHHERDKLEGVIGYVPQDDLLLQKLTVYQNLYYNAKLCLDHLSEEQLQERVDRLLKDLGLYEVKDHKVGSPLNQWVSGGQRKRLNIAFELIREPSVLFVDEPTSGLSSRDSENIMDLLKELTFKGKLIFVVIHQPSSEIYKLFDNVIILDIGGYPVYYGNPVEAIMYFKDKADQINSDVAQCPACGNVHPEQIFDILEANVVNEFGRLTDQRKVTPAQWHQAFKEQEKLPPKQSTKKAPPRSLYLPNRLKQWWLFLSRDIRSKLANAQYMTINLLEAPVLAFVLAFIITYIDNPQAAEYVFMNNKNVPAYLFMCVIVALFIGLTISAEEIFRDRKIREREHFLSLSYASYLLSKVGILFAFSAVQMLLFVVVGNWVIGIQEMHFRYWLALFTTACFANMLGLNISSAFDSAVTIYILIPILLIPQMILSGAIFKFDNLNEAIGNKVEVPLIADFMTARWAYEALAVNQFKNNAFEKIFYDLDKKESQANFKQVYLVPTLQNKLKRVQEADLSIDSVKQQVKDDLIILRNELREADEALSRFTFPFVEKLHINALDPEVFKKVRYYLDQLDDHYTRIFNKANTKKDRLLTLIKNNPEKRGLYKELKEDHHNKRLATVVKNRDQKERIIEYRGRLIQRVDLIFKPPAHYDHLFDYRTHFYAPKKHWLGIHYDTFWFNMVVIWLMSVALYVTLYFNILRKCLLLFNARYLRERLGITRFKKE